MEPEGYYCVNKSPLPAHILSQMNRIHNFPLYFPKLHYNTILTSTPRSAEWFSLQVSQSKLCTHF
jgi:hypothetical protein